MAVSMRRIATSRGRFGLGALTLLGLSVGGTACKVMIERPASAGPSTLQVDLLEGDVGSDETPIAFGAPHRYRFDVKALRADGSLYEDFEGRVHITVGPNGAVLSDAYVDFVGGQAVDVEVELERVHGDVQVWFEDVNPAGEGSYATGLSPTLHIAHPTIRNLQETDDIEANALEGDFVNLRAADRNLVVTDTTNNGFHVTDLDDDAFNSLFVFTFSAPRGLEVGSRITYLDGTADEFLGLTELSFPAYKAEGELAVPDPVLLDVTTINDELAMEALEASLVEARDLIVCPTDADFDVYGQWTALLSPSGSCADAIDAITVVSTFTVPSFDPKASTGETVRRITGILRYVGPANPPWILTPRFEDDLER